MGYSLFAPGKRLRPLLVVLACEAAGGAAGMVGGQVLDLEAEGRLQETGDRSGDRRQETRDRGQETGDRRQETGDRRQESTDKTAGSLPVSCPLSPVPYECPLSPGSSA